MGGIVSSLGQELGLIADEGVGAGSAAESRSLQERAVRELEKLDIPSMEAQQLVLERPELVAQLIPELAKDTELSDIQLSPGLRDSQLEAIEATKELSEAGGFTPETLARFEAVRRQVEGDESARQASIIQSMSERGQSGEGAELAARLASSQAATQRQSNISKDMLMQAPSARLQALQQAGQMSGQLRSQDYGEQSRAAEAQDVINKFNIGLQNQAQQYNVGQQQRIADERAGLSREEERQRAGLHGQKFQQEFQKASGTAGQLGNLAQGHQQQAGAEAQAAQQRAAATTGLITGGVKTGLIAGGVGGFGAEDGGIKESPMAYEDGGMGTIIPGDSYAGDMLPDRLNSGEAVLNLDMQDTIKDELTRSSRTDEQVDEGSATVNSDAQDELMAVARGEMSPEEMSDKPIVEGRKSKMDVLQELLEALR